MTLKQIMSLIGLTIKAPAQSATVLYALKPPRGVLWTALALIAVLSVLMTKLTLVLAPVEMSAQSPLPEDAFALLVLLFVGWAASIALTHYVSVAFDGRGSFDDSLLIVVWMQAVLLVMQVVQIVLIVVSPLAAAFFGYAAMIWVFLIFLIYVKQLHRFRSLVLVFLGSVGAGLALIFAISLAFTVLSLVLGLDRVNV